MCQIKELCPARPGRWVIVPVFAAILLSFALAAGAATFTATLDQDTITLGESVNLTLKFEGADPDGTPGLPAIPNLQVIAGPAKSSQTMWVNGVVSSSVSFIYEVRPTQAGEVTIPALAAKVGGQTLQTATIKLKVQPPGAPGQGPAGRSEANPGGVFLKMQLPKTEVYLGEVLPIELKLYVQYGKLTEMPHFNEEGFTVGKMLQPSQTSTIYNNQRYNVATFKTFVVPAKVGKLDIGPASMALNVPRPNSRRNFFGEFMDIQNITLQSEPASVQVLPLPRENVPANFQGAVGAYALNVTVSPTNVAVGDPVTIKAQISGRGAVDSITLPDQAGWDHFKVYPPTSEFQSGDDLGISGTKTFALTAVPDSLEVRELPPFSFSFFDPDAKSYRTLTQPAVPLTVRPSAASMPIASGNQEHDPSHPAARDIVHIKPRLGTLAQIQPPLFLRSWFIGLQAVPILAWVSMLLNRRQRDKLANNPKLRRQLHVEQIVRDNLKELRTSAQSNQRDAFFATLFHLLQEQLGERLDLPASAITEAVIDERLRPRGLASSTLDLLRELFQACNQARYAHQDSNEDLLSLIPKAEAAVAELRKFQA